MNDTTSSGEHGASGYFGEILSNWRPLLAALIGMGTGFSFNSYVTSIMAPHFIAEFHWPRADFAAITSLSLIMVPLFPVVGRVNDLIGVRRTALIGVVVLPLVYFELSRMNGDIHVYMVLFLIAATLCITTTATVFTRIVVQYVERARGLALAIVASGPAFCGIVLAPRLNDFVEVHGWREGYLVAAIFTALAGAVSLLIMPPERKSDAAKAGTPFTRSKQDYSEILNNGAFWILLASMLLCNLPQVLALTQLNILLQENGVPTAGASIMISAFAAGTLLGRFVCGVALDRFPFQIVAAISMALPSVGLFIFASSFDAPWLLTLAVFLIGLSIGAEGDLIGYIVVNVFGVRVYSSVMGLMTAAIATSTSLGAILLSETLAATSTFVLFLTICGLAVMIGAAALLFLKRAPAGEAAR